MADEFDKDGIVETDGGVEFGPGGVVERDITVTEVTATLDELALTAYAATVAVVINVSATFQTLALTAYSTVVASSEWTKIIIEGIDAITGNFVYIIGRTKDR